jgi:hypothetical protein
MEGRIGEGFSIEANVLLRPMKNTITYTEFPTAGLGRSTIDHYVAVKAWEFPVLLKYTLPAARFGSRLRPFVEAGPSFRTQEDAGATELSPFGVSAGAGVALHSGSIRIAPALRYMRWQNKSIYPKYPPKADQLEFLASIAYETDSSSRSVFGRNLSVGVLAGLPVTHGFGAKAYGGCEVERLRFLAGLSLELHLAGSVSVAADGIYRPLNAKVDEAYGQAHFSAVTWQFPVLAKYRWSRKV